jgi:hypothetical protein
MGALPAKPASAIAEAASPAAGPAPSSNSRDRIPYAAPDAAVLLSTIDPAPKPRG